MGIIEVLKATGFTPSPALGICCEVLPLLVPSFLHQMRPLWVGTLPPFPTMSYSQKPGQQELDHGGLLHGSGNCLVQRGLVRLCRPARQLEGAEAEAVLASLACSGWNIAVSQDCANRSLCKHIPMCDLDCANRCLLDTIRLGQCVYKKCQSCDLRTSI